MGSIDEIQQVCRLCLDKDEVNIPIFDESSDARQTFLKISACLPVKVSRDDNLPKNICDGCSCKLDMLYVFRNTSVDSEKQLIQWLNQAGLSVPPSTAVRDGAAKPEILVKQEAFDSSEMSEAQNYLIQQQKLTYSEEFAFGEVTEDSPGDLLPENEEPSPKRARRSTAKRQPVLDDTDDDEMDSMHITKAEADEDDSDDGDQADYGDTASADDQPGPSGVNRSGADAPSKKLTRRQKSKSSKIVYKNPFVYKNLKKKLKNVAIKKEFRPPVKGFSTKWVCMICSEMRMDKNSLIDHYEFHKHEMDNLGVGDHSSGDYFLCPVCLTDFTSLKSYEKHVENQHGEKPFSCDMCNQYFKNSYQLSIHNYNSHTGSSNYECVLCGFSSPRMKSLRNHLNKSHKDEFKYRCKICSRGFTSLSWFEEHKNFHTGAMPFECEICMKSFPYTRYLVAHKRMAHPDAESSHSENHECGICHKNFAHKKTLVYHLKGHTGENSALCDMCGKYLSSSEHLKQHQRIHTGHKPHTCAVCGKGFAKKCNLTLHERVHSGEKPYVCRTCGKSFSQRSTLVIHQRYHSGERPYVCHICNKGFVAKGLLGVHLKTCLGMLS